MARVYKRKARKDYPKDGIKKGDEYYIVSLKTGPRSSRTLRSLRPFRRSQLTTSEYLSTLYDIEDDLQSFTLVEELSDIVDRWRPLAEETQGKFDNMPEGLQQSETGQLLEERIQSCENAADELESLLDDWDEDNKTEESEADLVEQAKQISADN